MLHGAHHNHIGVMGLGEFTDARYGGAFQEVAMLRRHTVAFGQGRERFLLGRTQCFVDPGGQGQYTDAHVHGIGSCPVIHMHQFKGGRTFDRQFSRSGDNLVVEHGVLFFTAQHIDNCQDLARPWSRVPGDQMHRRRAVAQQLPIQRGEEHPLQPGIVLGVFDNQRQRQLVDEMQDLFIGMLHPHHFAGHCQALFTQRLRLGCQPLAMGVQIAFARLANLLGSEQPGKGQGLQVIERDDMQR